MVGLLKVPLGVSAVKGGSLAVVEIRTRGTLVGVRNGLLRIGEHNLHPDDIDMVIAEVPAVSVTGDALALLSSEGIDLVICAHDHAPLSMLVPLRTGGTLSARSVRRQAGLSARRRDALWRQIVQAKILAQAGLLEDTTRRNAGRLRMLARAVTAGDPDNKEAQAARLYWPCLFGDAFRRHASDDINGMLDFGYAVLRAGAARSIHAAGLLRSIGIHHDNAENDGALADDFMEPFRPVVDRQVYAMAREGLPMDRAARRRLSGVLEWPVLSGSEWVRLRTALGRLSLSFRKVVEGGPARLTLPSRIGTNRDAGGLEEDVGSRLL